METELEPDLVLNTILNIYFTLNFAVIPCKCNIYSYVVLGSVTFEGTGGKYISKVLLMVLLPEKEALAYRNFNSSLRVKTIRQHFVILGKSSHLCFWFFQR